MTSFDDRMEQRFSLVQREPEDMHQYQHTGSDFMYDNPFSALFIDLGLGKTIISLTTLVRLMQNFEFERALIIAPLRVANMTWPNEIPMWRHSAILDHHAIRNDDLLKLIDKDVEREKERHLLELKTTLKELGATPDLIKSRIAAERKTPEYKVHLEKARRIATRKRVQEDFKSTTAPVHIISRENVEFLVAAWGRHWPYDVVIIDESSSLKDYKTRRFKALKKVRPFIKRMHQLTATPAAETYLHLFAQIYLLDGGERLGKSFTAFRDNYFSFNAYTYETKLKPGAEDEIIQKISDICLVMKSEDYLDIEEPLFVPHRVHLSDAEMRQYRDMERHLVVTLRDGSEVEAETAAELSQKLLQMASGVLYEKVLEEQSDGTFKRKRVVHEIHNQKLEKLQQLVEESCGEPLIVIYWHKSSIERIRKVFAEAETLDDHPDTEERWNKKKVPLLLIHPQSAGHGLNLQHGGYQIVFFDIPWSLELYLQVIGRLAGGNRALVHGRPVVLHHIIADGTLDDVVVEALKRKEDAQMILFRKLKEIRGNLHRQLKVAYNASCCEETL